MINQKIIDAAQRLQVHHSLDARHEHDCFYIVLIEITNGEYSTSGYFEVNSINDIDIDSVKSVVNCAISLDFKGLKSQRLYITRGDIYNGRGFAFFKKN